MPGRGSLQPEMKEEEKQKLQEMSIFCRVPKGLLDKVFGFTVLFRYMITSKGEKMWTYLRSNVHKIKNKLENCTESFIGRHFMFKE